MNYLTRCFNNSSGVDSSSGDIQLTGADKQKVNNLLGSKDRYFRVVTGPGGQPVLQTQTFSYPGWKMQLHTENVVAVVWEEHCAAGHGGEQATYKKVCEEGSIQPFVGGDVRVLLVLISGCC